MFAIIPFSTLPAAFLSPEIQSVANFGQEEYAETALCSSGLPE
jgi:hypothetical protein